MYVRVLSLGSNWWTMHSQDRDDPLCFRKEAAFFNAAALLSGRRLHHSAAFPGRIRFNSKSGFDPEFPQRAIGRIFECTEPRRYRGKTHLLIQRRVSNVVPDAFLVTFRSVEHGAIQFSGPAWKSKGVQPISISVRGLQFEAMLLLGVRDWVISEFGRWQIDSISARIVLNELESGEIR